MMTVTNLPAKGALKKMRTRVRTGIGFALGLTLLALVDLWYYFLPKFTGRLRRQYK